MREDNPPSAEFGIRNAELDKSRTTHSPEQQFYCCVCGEPVYPPCNLIGQRVYCDRHFAVVNKQHLGLWRTAIVQIVAMGILSAILYLLADYIGPIDDP